MGPPLRDAVDASRERHCSIRIEKASTVDGEAWGNSADIYMPGLIGPVFAVDWIRSNT